MVVATHEIGTPQNSLGSEQLLQGNYPSLLLEQRDSAHEKAASKGGFLTQDASEESADVEASPQEPMPDVLARGAMRDILRGAASHRQAQNTTTFFKQLAKRVLQFVIYGIYVVPPALMTGFWCAFMLYAIKLATALRNGTCGENTYEDFKNTDHPLVACTDVVGAHRWLLFLLSFSGMAVAALYTFTGNANAAGGMTTILQSIKAMEEEINRIGEEDARREANGEERGRIEESSDFRGMIALRMCPLVWIGTVSTHLFGGSVGREGSALQMAAAIFSKYCDFVDGSLRMLRGSQFGLSVQFKRAGLVAAIASGFSGIFGVPITGAIFAVEVLRVGEITIGEMLIPAVVGSVFADMACRYVNMHWFDFEGHSEYNCPSCQGFPAEGPSVLPVGTPQAWYAYQNYTELLAILLAGFFFGLCGYAFEWLLHHFKDIFSRAAEKVAGTGNTKTKTLLTPFIGGWVVVLFWLGLCGAATTSTFNLPPTYSGNDPYGATFGQAYLGLSVYEPGVSISSCFNMGTTWQVEGPAFGTPVMSIMWYSWLIKLFLTTVSLGAGFKGGEVTPLFFIGAALGNWIGVFLGQDVQLFAALGLVSVFSAAANTPIACTFMGIELFGGAKALSFFVSCYVSYVVSNSDAINGIYKQQKPRNPNGAVVPYSRRRPNLV
jgi:H+/Cl- antiporter ClcA